MGYDDGSGNGAPVTCGMGADTSARSAGGFERGFSGDVANTDGKWANGAGRRSTDADLGLWERSQELLLVPDICRFIGRKR